MQEMFYDPLADEKDQKFINENMKKHFDNDWVLSCPSCFI